MYFDASERDVSIQSRQAALYFVAATRIHSGHSGSGYRIVGVSGYLIFDLKRTSLSSKAPLLYGY